MTQFYFLMPGATLAPALAAAGVIGVPVSQPPSAPAPGYAWVIGSPQAVQVNGVWQQNWVQQAIPLATAQGEALATVAATLAAKLAAGLASGSNVIAIDAAAQSEIAALAILALATISGTATTPWPTGRTWPVVSGTPIPLTTPQDLIAVGAPAAHYVWSLKNYATLLAAQIGAATTAAAVQAIDLVGGWPTS